MLIKPTGCFSNQELLRLPLTPATFAFVLPTSWASVKPNSVSKHAPKDYAINNVLLRNGGEERTKLDIRTLEGPLNRSQRAAK